MPHNISLLYVGSRVSQKLASTECLPIQRLFAISGSLSHLRVSRRTIIGVDIELGNEVATSLVKVPCKACILERKVGRAKVVGRQFIPKGCGWEAIPGHEVSVEPLPSSILNIIIVGVAKAEVMGANAILVIDHFRVSSIPANIAGSFDLVVSVLRRGHVLGFTVLHPDDNMFPIVTVTQVEYEVRHDDTIEVKSQ